MPARFQNLRAHFFSFFRGIDSAIISTQKIFVFVVLCCTIQVPASAQTGCDCPEAGDCGPCIGGLESVTIEYIGGGLLNLTFTAEDGGGTLPGGGALLTSVITINSRTPGQPFEGGFVTVTITNLIGGSLVATGTISTTCGTPIYQGTLFGSNKFVLLGGESVGGVTLCCSPTEIEEIGVPVFTLCPTDQTIDIVSGCSAVANWLSPTATTSCGEAATITPTSGHSSGQTFPLGETIVTYTATDAYGNAETCSFTIDVRDITDPVIDCPGNFTELVNTSCNFELDDYSFLVNTSDNCDGDLEITQSPPPGTIVSGAGTVVPIMFTATDDAGNSNSCSFNVTLIDVIPPQFVCPTAHDELLNEGCEFIVPDYRPAFATDNCDSSVPIVQIPAPGTVLAGVNTVHAINLTATDDSGIQKICDFNITLRDVTDPLFTSFPSDQELYTGGGSSSCEVIANWALPVASDNCSASVTQTAGTQSGTPFTVGVHQVTYKAEDAAGNFIEESFTITVIDDTDPVFTSFPSNQELFTGDGNTTCTVNANWATPVATDNCSVTVTQTIGAASGTLFAVGVHQITYKAEDPAGNFIEESFTITVIDDTDPEFTSFPSDQELYTGDENTTCTVNASWATPVATDNCSVTVTQPMGAASGTLFAVGVHQITYKAEDPAGNFIEESFTITVYDDTDPEFTSFPPDQILYTGLENTSCTVVATWAEPTTSDNCDPAPILASNFASGHAFPLGTTQVTYTVTDASGNTADESFFVTVEDNTDPVINNLPSDISINAPSNSCQTTVSWTAPTATDNCDTDVALTTTAVNGANFPVGETLVTYTATDNVGNDATGTFKVTVNDITAPTFSGCPTNITKNSEPTACTAIVSWTAPIAADACGVNVTSTHAPGSTFPVGVTTVKYTAKDPWGNETICSFTVTVKDVTAPTISNCSHGVTLEFTADNSCDAVATWTEPTATDKCSVSMTRSHVPGSTFPLGKTDIVYTFTDPSGNISTCAFKVMVKDITAPLISGCVSADIVVDLSSGCEASATWTPPTFTDNCSATMSSSHTPGQMFPRGTTVVTYTATDPAGNFATCSFNVIVEDHIDPVFDNCISSDIVASSGDECGAVVNWTSLTATDNCGETLVETTHNPGSFFEVGTTEVTYTATDAVGNFTTCVFNVVVNDDTPPVITNCPADILVSADESCEAIVTWDAPTAIDNCSTTTLTSNFDVSHVFEIGTTEVKYTATDADGNVSYCAFNVIVTDDTPPVIACGADITVNADANCQASVSWDLPPTSDNCSAVAMTSSNDPGDLFPIGETEVTYTATDAEGNSTSCTFKITVIDTTAPVINDCPSDVIVSATGSSCEVSASWTPPTAGDNCTTATITSSHEPGDLFAIGTTAIVYTATDAAGNTSTCSFNVVVDDGAAPVFITQPVDVTVSTEDECSAPASWTAPSVSDCGVITLTSTHTAGSIFPVGSTEVVYTASDESGNTSTTKFNVIVEDKTAPAFVNCPEDAQASADPSCTASVTWTPPNAEDNCETLSIVSTHNPGDAFPIGETEVTYTATDAEGNTTTCTFKITVIDTTAPVINGCPSDVIVSATGSSCEVSASWTPPTAGDNCMTATITSSHEPGDLFAIGTTQVIYTATDAAGNTSTCSFNVVVADEAVPIFTTQPGDVTVSTGDACSASANWTAPSVSDCGVITLTSTHASGSSFPVGSTEVVYTASDESGNISTTEFKVIVEDKTAPAFVNCPEEVFANADPSCTASATWTPPNAVDNCELASIVSTHNSGDVFEKGTTEVTYTATDIYGNTSVCKFRVVVGNQHPPVITGCPGSIVLKADASGQVAGDWTPPTATVVCGEVSMASSHLPGALFQLGTTPVTYTATDSDGNATVCSFNVTVEYDEVHFDVVPIITPDGDGINDQWTLANIEKFLENRVVIVDRWGSVIFTAHGYNNQSVVWKGQSSSGGVVPTGTYFYTIGVRIGPDYREKKGFVELIR